MEITPEIQAHFDVIFNKRFAELHAKNEAKMTEAITEVETKHKAEVVKFKSDFDALKASKGSVDDKAVTERIAAIEGQLKQAREAAVKGRLESIGARMNAVNPEQVAVLIRQFLKTDDSGNLTVVNADGLPRLNAASKPMTEEEVFKEFLDNNPHMVKASGTAGAGSAGRPVFSAGATKAIKRGDYEALSPQAKSDFIKAGGTPVD